MEPYSSFAQVYDLFMDQVPYERWADRIVKRLTARGICDGLVLDLGCGTGTMTELLAARGYDMIGVDYSDEMLQIAQEKSRNSGQDILYLQQDMKKLELYGTVRAAVCVCDSINYILHKRDLVQVFSLVNNYLDPGGIFLFDFNTPYKYETVLGNQTIAENREQGSFIWENTYDRKRHLNEYDLTLFLREKSGFYSRFEEVHCQRSYTQDELHRALSQAGLRFLTSYDPDTGRREKSDSQRIAWVAMEQGKEIN